MDRSIVIRRPRLDDVAEVARIHVLTWQQTYRGLMRDEVLDDPGFITQRERMWSAVVSDERYALSRPAIAERDGGLVGIALAGPPLGDDVDPSWTAQLYVLYVLADEYGSGVGAELLNAVIPSHESAMLWVADPNPRAQAFYRKHGFAADGSAQVDDDVREVRMVRVASTP